jgi:hypothetical protein
LKKPHEKWFCVVYILEGKQNMAMYTYTYNSFNSPKTLFMHGLANLLDHTYKMGVEVIGGDLQRLFNLDLALTMECLHSGAIGLRAHLEFVITNEQNNDKVIAC